MRATYTLSQTRRPRVRAVRRGLDYGRQGFSNWDLTREVLKAFARVSDND